MHPFSCLLCFFSRQFVSMCKFQGLQIVNVLSLFPVPRRTHWRLFRAQRGLPCSGAQAQRCSQKKMPDLLLWFAILNNKKTNKKHKTVAARLGGDFEMGQSFHDFTTESVNSKHLGKWPLLSEIGQPNSAASSKNMRIWVEESLSLSLFVVAVVKHLFCSCVDLALQHIDFPWRILLL